MFNIFSSSRVYDADKIVTNIEKQEQIEEELALLLLLPSILLCSRCTEDQE